MTRASRHGLRYHEALASNFVAVQVGHCNVPATAERNGHDYGEACALRAVLGVSVEQHPLEAELCDAPLQSGSSTLVTGRRRGSRSSAIDGDAGRR